ncbi:hypothetical protein DYB37_000144 [Aphanomyces astaci]|uniref:FYVE, RhoGEF and PH domain-containing protein 6 n=1 Tax=Aphanomyces astaci TaxID=112090 RepID=A0A418EAW8_APHAT|nr:hypothetical protein DYB35_000058 [Aphanomyces astaci]RHZ09975.1 hypothetical protein DYB37_000144 [Aphanomyces astaci]
MIDVRVASPFLAVSKSSRSAKALVQHAQALQRISQDSDVRHESTDGGAAYISKNPVPPPEQPAGAMVDLVVDEICSTEATYVKNLGILVESFVKPLQDDKHDMMANTAVAVFFSTLEELVKLNSTFLEELMQVTIQEEPGHDATERIGVLFNQFIPLFTSFYSDYAKFFDDFTPLLRDFKTQSKRLSTFLDVPNRMDETLRQKEQTEIVLSIQAQFAGQVSLFALNRRFVRSGMLVKMSTKRKDKVMVHMFNDMLLYSDVVSADTFHARRVVDFRSSACRVDETVPSSYVNLFGADALECGFMDKQAWVSAIGSLIAHTQATTTSPAVDNAAAVVWIPDSVAEECSQCGKPFRLLWRRHHCRRCGFVVCGHCSEHRSILFDNDPRPVRVCTTCHNVLTKVKECALLWLGCVIEFKKRKLLRRDRKNKWTHAIEESANKALKRTSTVRSRSVDGDDPDAGRGLEHQSGSIDLDQLDYLVYDDEKAERYRHQILTEIVRSEQSYVECLGTCIRMFVQPLMLREVERKRSVEHNSKLSLQRRFSQMSLKKHEQIKKTFTLMGLNRRANVPNGLLSTVIQDSCTKKTLLDADMSIFFTRWSERFMVMLSEIQMPMDETTMHQLRTFLNMPIERIPQYSLYLHDLKRWTTDGHMDHAPLLSSITAVNRVVHMLQDTIDARDNLRNLRQVELKYGLPPDKDRQFVKEGRLQKVCRHAVKVYHVVLFNNALLYAPTGWKAMYVRKHKIIDLKGCSVSAVDSLTDSVRNALSPNISHNNALQFLSSQKSFLLIADSPTDQIEWLAAIHDAIVRVEMSARLSISSVDDEDAHNNDAEFVIKSGWLPVKRGHKWKRMWVTVDYQHVSLATSFQAPPDVQLLIAGCDVEYIADSASCFQVTGEDMLEDNDVGALTKEFTLDALHDRDEWIRAIDHCVRCMHSGGDMMSTSAVSEPNSGYAPIYMFGAAKVGRNCTLCFEKFALIRTRHHCKYGNRDDNGLLLIVRFLTTDHYCRRCGNQVCGKCSKSKMVLATGSTKPERVCDKCMNVQRNCVLPPNL